MYSSIRINSYRGFDSFRMQGLGRVNLLVGTNNCGKTSILECIELLRSVGNPYVLSSIVDRRGEWGYKGDEESRMSLDDVSHLFPNHALRGAIRIEADRIGGGYTREAVRARPVNSSGPAVCQHPMSFGCSSKWCSLRAKKPSHKRSASSIRASSGLPPSRSTGDRSTVTVVGPGGVVLKLADSAGRVPIESMGDGMWRILGLALSLANVRGGVLLVDEIDTGLHYSVMENMWRMISDQAAALSVQVFATTHSRDCYESLAAIAKSNVGDVTIQRIDRSRAEAIRFSNQAIVAAAERNIEVR